MPKAAVPEPAPNGPSPPMQGGGIIAGIGFTPSQADLEALSEHFEFRPGCQYVMTRISTSDATSDVLLLSIYLKAAREHGWQTSGAGASITRQTIAGRDFIVLSEAAT